MPLTKGILMHKVRRVLGHLLCDDPPFDLCTSKEAIRCILLAFLSSRSFWDCKSLEISRSVLAGCCLVKIRLGAKSSWTTFLNHQIHCFRRHSNPAAFLVAYQRTKERTFVHSRYDVRFDHRLVSS